LVKYDSIIVIYILTGGGLRQFGGLPICPGAHDGGGGWNTEIYLLHAVIIAVYGHHCF
jgi:hypothetical protein